MKSSKYAGWVLALFVACGPPPVVLPDGAIIDAQDSGVIDAGLDDAGEGEDAGAPDAGDVDSGVPDAGTPDAGAPDAGKPDAGAPDAGVPGCPAPTGVLPPFTIRAMASNLTSGNNQSYDPGHGTRIMQGARPDIVMIQEFSYGANTTTAIGNYVSSTFGAEFSWWRGAGQIPNGVISRWPIVASGEWSGAAPNRNLTWAKIDLPGPHDVFVISVHFLTTSAANRNLDARTIMQQLDAGVSRYDYVLLGGDFNTDTFSEAAFTTLAPRFVVSAPWPADQNGNTGTNANRSKPYDHVVASTCLAATQVPTVLGATSFPAGAVIDTRVFGAQLSDIAPALAGDSAASQMQHMGVVKDFLISP